MQQVFISALPNLHPQCRYNSEHGRPHDLLEALLVTTMGMYYTCPTIHQQGIIFINAACMICEYHSEIQHKIDD
jgi:hypothetical protein